MHFQAPGRKPRRKNRFLSPLLLWPQKKWENVERQSAISIAKGIFTVTARGRESRLQQIHPVFPKHDSWNGEALNMRQFFWIQTFAKLFESSFHQN